MNYYVRENEEDRPIERIRNFLITIVIGFIIGAYICNVAQAERVEAAERARTAILIVDGEEGSSEKEPALDYISPVTGPATVYEMELPSIVEPWDGFLPYDFIPLSEDMQHLLWTECKANGIEFSFALATIKKESEFKSHATNYNTNGTVDKGIFQTNSCWWRDLRKLGMISDSDDLYNTEVGIRCGIWELSQCVAAFGNTERAYAYYNTGNRNVKSNANSRKVMQYMAEYEVML